MEQAETIGVLGSSALFHGLPEEQLAKITEIVEVRSCLPGHHVFLEGDLATEFYIVATGGVRVFIPTSDDQIDAAIVRHGQMFGEGGLLDGGPRLASATTLEPTTLLVIRRDAWLALIDRDAVLSRRVLMALGASIRRYVRHMVDFLFLDVDVPDYPVAEDGPGP